MDTVKEAKKQCKKIQEFIKRSRRRCDDCGGRLAFMGMRIVYTVKGVDEQAVCSFECLKCGRKYDFWARFGRWV